MKLLGPGDPQTLGQYRLLRALGAGGMGRVFLGRSAQGRVVAVKLIHPQYAAEPEFRRRFEREVAAARRVGGQWTAPVLDADTTGELPWVATGYVAGPPLQRVVDELYGPLPEPTLWRLTGGLAGALTAIHEAGLIHRDLKPSNVLVTVDGPKVIDFGIARAVDASVVTRTGAVIGSPGFMSPEQVRGERLDAASDVFCLGALLAYAASAAGPFDTENGAPHALMYRVVAEEPDLGRLEGPLRELVARCLAKDPAERPGPAEIARAAAEHAEEEGPWLPRELTHQLARDAAELLDLEGPTPTQIAAAPPTSAPPASVPPAHAAPTMAATTAPPPPGQAPSQGPPARGRKRALTIAVVAAVMLILAVALLRNAISTSNDLDADVTDNDAGNGDHSQPTEPAGDEQDDPDNPDNPDNPATPEETASTDEVKEPGEEGYFEGDWAGTIVVTNTWGTETDFEIEVDYTGGEIGDEVASVRYPGVCETTWRLEEERRESIVVYERVTQAEGDCNDDEITLTAIDPFTMSFAIEGTEESSAGELKRQ